MKHTGSDSPLSPRSWTALLVTGFFAVGALGAQLPHPESRMTFLDNGEVRIGMDLALGGAVTYISSKEHPSNIVNSADLGRQIQMSHYSGPWPFEVGDKKPNPAWAGLGWNPIQTGDCYMNPSKDIEAAYTGQPTTARVFWKRLADDKFDTRKSLILDLNPDSKFHRYHLDLSSSPEYRGLIIGLAIEPAPQPSPEQRITIKSVVLLALNLTSYSSSAFTPGTTDSAQVSLGLRWISRQTDSRLSRDISPITADCASRAGRTWKRHSMPFVFRLAQED